MNRRHLLRHGLTHGLALSPVAAALLAGCGQDEGHWAEGMLPIKWDRDTCARCNMVISDRRFAAQLRGGPRETAFKFDDIGCAASWCADKLKMHPWINDPATRLWVADASSQGTRWLDARRAHYVNGPRSPMGYDFAAQAQPAAGSVDFDTLARKVVEAWPSNCTPGGDLRRAASAAEAA